MSSLTERRAAGLTVKALPVEVEAVGADPLHHVDPPPTGVTRITGLGQRLLDRALGHTHRRQSHGPLL